MHEPSGGIGLGGDDREMPDRLATQRLPNAPQAGQRHRRQARLAVTIARYTRWRFLFAA